MGLAPYCASKHALECISESLQVELKPFNIQIQTINPEGYLRGFNETMAESVFHWQDDTLAAARKRDPSFAIVSGRLGEQVMAINQKLTKRSHNLLSLGGEGVWGARGDHAAGRVP
jgi:NAD(P)-dependent dehydrogenase (short-subunit alcohol dehydrogenase family)